MLYRLVAQDKSIQQTYADSFNYRHDPGKDWKMLAYLADWSDDIAVAYRAGSDSWISGQPPATCAHHVVKPAEVTIGAAQSSPTTTAE
jgi:hypothetical protein